MELKEQERSVDLSGAVIPRSNFSHSDLVGADFRDTVFRDSNFTMALLMDANLEGADFTGASLFGADLEGAKLKGAIFERANLAKANLGGASLEKVKIHSADLRETDLSATKDVSWFQLLSAKIDTNTKLPAELDLESLLAHLAIGHSDFDWRGESNGNLQQLVGILAELVEATNSHSVDGALLQRTRMKIEKELRSHD